MPVIVLPDIAPLTTNPEEIIPLPLMLRFPAAKILPVVIIDGIEIELVKTPVKASMR